MLIADEYRREVELSEINDKQLFDYLKCMMQQARINRKISELKQKLTYDSDIKKKVAEACLNDIELILNEYYVAAEPPVRCGESHHSGQTEPPCY